MPKATLEAVVERLDRLEKIIAEMNQQLSWLVKESVPNISENYENIEMESTDTLNDELDADIGVKAIERMLERMGYPPDFDPGPIEELHESMRQHGILAEDNEFSRAIIAEREK